MSDPDEPPLPPGTEPIGDLLLAQALEACLQAEPNEPGSSARIVAQMPSERRADLERLLDTVRRLEALSERATPSAPFRAAARHRLLRRIGADLTEQDTPRPIGGARLVALARTRVRRPSRWLARSLAALAAALAASVAVVNVSASALPGDALYGVKQMREEFGVRLAADDDDRVLALLRRADARLDETARLLEQGRTLEAVESAQRYDAVVERATTALIVTADFGNIEPARSAELESTLDQQHTRVQEILQVAPEPARANLRESLVTTERGRQLVAEPRPDRPVVRRSAPASAPAHATEVVGQVEEQPTPSATLVPTARPTVIASGREPPVIAQVRGPGPVGTSEATSSDDDDDERQGRSGTVAADHDDRRAGGSDQNRDAGARGSSRERGDAGDNRSGRNAGSDSGDARGGGSAGGDDVARSGRNAGGDDGAGHDGRDESERTPTVIARPLVTAAGDQQRRGSAAATQVAREAEALAGGEDGNRDRGRSDRNDDERANGDDDRGGERSPQDDQNGAGARSASDDNDRGAGRSAQEDEVRGEARRAGDGAAGRGDRGGRAGGDDRDDGDAPGEPDEGPAQHANARLIARPATAPEPEQDRQPRRVGQESSATAANLGQAQRSQSGSGGSGQPGPRAVAATAQAGSWAARIPTPTPTPTPEVRRAGSQEPSSGRGDDGGASNNVGGADVGGGNNAGSATSSAGSSSGGTNTGGRSNTVGGGSAPSRPASDGR
jgi:hypothetical protein